MTKRPYLKKCCRQCNSARCNHRFSHPGTYWRTYGGSHPNQRCYHRSYTSRRSRTLPGLDSSFRRGSNQRPRGCNLPAQLLARRTLALADGAAGERAYAMRSIGARIDHATTTAPIPPSPVMPSPGSPSSIVQSRAVELKSHQILVRRVGDIGGALKSARRTPRSIRI